MDERSLAVDNLSDLGFVYDFDYDELADQSQSSDIMTGSADGDVVGFTYVESPSTRVLIAEVPVQHSQPRFAKRKTSVDQDPALIGLGFISQSSSETITSCVDDSDDVFSTDPISGHQSEGFGTGVIGVESLADRVAGLRDQLIGERELDDGRSRSREMEAVKVRCVLGRAFAALADSRSVFMNRAETAVGELPDLRLRKVSLAKRVTALIAEQDEEKARLEIRKRQTDAKMKVIVAKFEDRKVAHGRFVNSVNEREEQMRAPFKAVIEVVRHEVAGHEDCIAGLKAEIEYHKTQMTLLQQQIMSETAEMERQLKPCEANKECLLASEREIEAEENKVRQMRVKIEEPYRYLIDRTSAREQEISTLQSALERIDTRIRETERTVEESNATAVAVADMTKSYEVFAAKSASNREKHCQTIQSLAVTNAKKSEAESALVVLNRQIATRQDMVDAWKVQIPQLEARKRNAIATKNFKGAQQIVQQLKELMDQLTRRTRQIEDDDATRTAFSDGLETILQTLSSLDEQSRSESKLISTIEREFYTSFLQRLQSVIETQPSSLELLGPLRDVIATAVDGADFVLTDVLRVFNNRLEAAVAREDFKLSEEIQCQINVLIS